MKHKHNQLQIRMSIFILILILSQIALISGKWNSMAHRLLNYPHGKKVVKDAVTGKWNIKDWKPIYRTVYENKTSVEGWLKKNDIPFHTLSHSPDWNTFQRE